MALNTGFLYILYPISNKPQYTGRSDQFNDFLTAVNESLEEFSNSLLYPGLRRNTPTSSASNAHEDSCPKSLISRMLGNQDWRKTGGDFEMHEKKIFFIFWR